MRPLICLVHLLLMQIPVQSTGVLPISSRGIRANCSGGDPGLALCHAHDHCHLGRLLEWTFLSFMDQHDALLLQAAVSTTTCDTAQISARRFSSAALPPSVLQLTTGSCMTASPSPGFLSLKQMCFQDKNNIVSCKCPSASLFACTQQIVCLGMACVGT